MNNPTPQFLPGVPADHVLARLSKSDGHEITSGKLNSPESSAALAVNTFGWFVDQPRRLPRIDVFPDIDWPATFVEVEYQVRFPWRGGRHPWLDAFVETESAIIGVESKRFEPFRDKHEGVLSSAYDRDVWHDRMGPFQAMRDRLRSGQDQFEHLDAVQLVKHAFGLVTKGRRVSKRPYLLYLFAEPTERARAPVSPLTLQRHRGEVERFAEAVTDAEVSFQALSYRDWLATWPTSDGELVAHRDAILSTFRP